MINYFIILKAFVLVIFKQLIVLVKLFYSKHNPRVIL